MADRNRIEIFFGRIGKLCMIIGVVVVWAVAGHYILAIGDSIKDWASPLEDDRVYESFPERRKVNMELPSTWNYEFKPYYHWRRREFHGEYFNVSAEGVRHTVKSPNKGAKKVFIFGGSTTWGTDVADGQTIPSYLQSMLGDDYDLYNFGEAGYVSAQEINLLLELLTLGDIPDAVVFYDGANDGYAGAYAPAVPRSPLHFMEMMRRLDEERQKSMITKLYEGSNYKDLVDYLRRKLKSDTTVSWDESVEGDIDKNAEKVVEIYDRHIRQVKLLSREYGFKAFFFWQPYLFSLTKETHPYEEDIIKNASETHVKAMRRVYLEAKERFSNREAENIFFIADSLDDLTEPIYTDFFHVVPKGNHTIAKRMYEHLNDRL